MDTSSNARNVFVQGFLRQTSSSYLFSDVKENIYFFNVHVAVRPPLSFNMF